MTVVPTRATLTILSAMDHYRLIFIFTVSLLLRLPVGRGGVINSPRFRFFSRVESRRTAHG